MSKENTLTIQDHVDTFIEYGMACNFDGSQDSLIPAIIQYGSGSNATEIMIGTEAMKNFADEVIKKLKLA
jgi:hypothetical protein